MIAIISRCAEPESSRSAIGARADAGSAGLASVLPAPASAGSAVAPSTSAAGIAADAPTMRSTAAAMPYGAHSFATSSSYPRNPRGSLLHGVEAVPCHWYAPAAAGTLRGRFRKSFAIAPLAGELARCCSARTGEPHFLIQLRSSGEPTSSALVAIEPRLPGHRGCRRTRRAPR